jgi:hypothetical protein
LYRIHPISTTSAAALALSAALAAPSTAQQDDFLLPLPPVIDSPARSLSAPAISIGAPTGFGAAFGDIFLGIGAQSRTRYADKPDGGAVVGIGLGDPRRYLGLEVAVSQFGTLRSCCRGGVSLKLHRMLPGATSVAVGWENVTGWGQLPGGNITGEFTDAGSSVYGAVSRVFFLDPHGRHPYRSVAATVGVGDGRFRREGDILTGRERVNAFGSLGVRLVEPASVVATWTGQDLNAGLSISPVPSLPVAFTVGAADLTTMPRFIVGAGIGINYPVPHHRGRAR